MSFDYFYENQADQFTFYRIPKILFTDDRFKKLSTDGKVLYGLLLDRVGLSREHGWIDEEGKVYIIFSINSVHKAMRCSVRSAVNYLAELERFGLIEKVRQEEGQPNLIYVMNYLPMQNLHKGECKNCIPPSVNSAYPPMQNLHSNNTNNNNTDFNNTNLILSKDEDRMGYEEYLQDQLEIPILKQDYPYETETIDGIVDLILDVLCSKRQTIQIAGDEKSVNVVKGRFMKLNIEHIRYVMDCLNHNDTKVRNIKQYILAALYNAPSTIGSYYRAEVNHDMATGKI